MRFGVFSLCLMLLLGLSVCLTGCGTGSSSAPSPHTEGVSASAPSEADHAGHEHAAKGPHGGDLIELGDEEYHAELLHDEATHTVLVHLLDAAGKEHVPISQGTITLQLFQNGQFVDYTLQAKEPGPNGASEFALTDEQLADTLLQSENVRGRLRVTIGGKDYVGKIEHQPHDHEGHGHAKEGHNRE